VNESHKAHLCALLDRAGLNAMFRRSTRHRLKVIAYHGVLPAPRDEAAYGSLHISLASFEAHLAHLRACYCVLALDEAVAHLRAGKSLPANAVALTFDDGYANTLDVALPALAARGMSATHYVCTRLAEEGTHLWYDALRSLVFARHGAGRAAERAYFALVHQVGSGSTGTAHARTAELLREARMTEDHLRTRLRDLRLLTWEEIRRLAGSGHAVGSHTRSHALLDQVDHATVVDEIRGSYDDLAKELGAVPGSFAFPDGRLTREALEVVRTTGYRSAVTVDDRDNGPGADPFQLARVVVSDHGHPAIFEARLAGSLSFLRRWLRRGSRLR